MTMSKTMQQQNTLKKYVDDKMQSKQVKQVKNWEFEIPSEQETKRLKANKHKIQEDNAKTLGSK